MSRDEAEGALERIYQQLQVGGTMQTWTEDWEVVLDAIETDVAVGISTDEGYLIRVRPEHPETGPDRLEAVAATLPKDDDRRHQLLRLAHQWRSTRAF